MEAHDVFVYACNWCAKSDLRCFIVDCEEHLTSESTPHFFDAIGRAMLHRGAAIR